MYNIWNIEVKIVITIVKYHLVITILFFADDLDRHEASVIFLPWHEQRKWIAFSIFTNDSSLLLNDPIHLMEPAQSCHFLQQ